jgi:hypothetical protein
VHAYDADHGDEDHKHRAHRAVLPGAERLVGDQRPLADTLASALYCLDRAVAEHRQH